MTTGWDDVSPRMMVPTECGAEHSSGDTAWGASTGGSEHVVVPSTCHHGMGSEHGVVVGSEHGVVYEGV